MRMRFVPVVAVLVCGMSVHSLAAQDAGEPVAHTTLVPIPYRSYVGFNPLGIPFDIFVLEAESGIAQGVTMGGVGSYVSVNHDRYTTFEFKARYYPGEVVLQGFSLGMTAGYLGFSTPSRSIASTTGEMTARDKLNAPTIGVIVDYNWLLGQQRRFVVGTGVGAKRVLASADDRQRVGLDRALLTARFTVGLAF